MEPSTIHYLLYYSVLHTDSTDEDLEDIFNRSIRNNIRNQITGVMIYQDGKFMSLLEGEKEALESTFNRISKDDRHQFLKILVSGKHQKRLYEHWRAFWNPLTNQDLYDISRLNNLENFVPQDYLMQADKTFVRELLRDFYENKGLDFAAFWSK
ncbi:MAG: BLUF domain-containing protein [Luteibaculaceae bacterium]